MGNYRNIIAGDKCDSCKIGYIERVIVPPTGAETVFCLVTLGLGGDGGSQYYRCTHCKKELLSNKIWDESLPEDKPRTWNEMRRDSFLLIAYISVAFILVVLIYLVFAGAGYLVGMITNG